MQRSGTVVIGGGIVGLSAGYYLACRGEPVTVIERDPIGVGASSGNAGILALGHPPLPRPGLFGQLLRLVLDRTNPLYIPLRFDPSLIPWLVSFQRACGKDDYDRSVAILCRMGWAAGACFQELIEREGIECEHHRTGWLDVYRSREALAHGRKGAEPLRALGYRVDELSGDELRSREPVFRDEVAGAMHYTDSGFANPEKFVRGLASAAQRRGVRLLERTEVSKVLIRDARFTGVQLTSGERIDADRLVLAAGVWTTELARSAGIRVPMQAGKGYHINLSGVPARPSTICVLAETFVAATPLEGGLRLAGTVELSGLNLRLARQRLDRLMIGARRYLRGLEEARIDSTWCGLRPLTADGLPVIGWAPVIQGVFIATGHAMMGFLLGSLTGKLVSEILLDGTPSMDIAGLGADRF